MTILLLLGRNVLASPLTAIINKSILTGTVPAAWKETVVTPILKKANPNDKANYRPVSCLITASKVLEKVVCTQLTEFIEKNKLLPNSQHGFRQQRSTMTAHAHMQKDWIVHKEEGQKTGILIWDLSAAFDTLDIDLLCKKLSIYCFTDHTVSWFRSFLTSRTQRVKIGKTLSDLVELNSGVPQGGILSPIIFTLYTADLELWCKFSKIFNHHHLCVLMSHFV